MAYNMPHVSFILTWVCLEIYWRFFTLFCAAKNFYGPGRGNRWHRLLRRTLVLKEQL